MTYWIWFLLVGIKNAAMIHIRKCWRLILMGSIALETVKSSKQIP